MGCFQVRYDSRVVIYERKLFIRLATGLWQGLNQSLPNSLGCMGVAIRCQQDIFTVIV